MNLRCAVHDSPSKWRRWLPMAEFWYNSTFHSSLQCTPFKALYGKEANLGAMATWAEATPAGDDLAWAEHADAIRAQLARAQHRFKKQADKHRVERSFQVGEQVLLKLQPYVQRSVVSRPCAKLAYKFFGPYTMLEKIGPLAYKLDLPPDSRVHPVFHVSQLKPFTPDYSPVFNQLSATADLTIGDLVPQAILELRQVKKGNAAIPQVLVQWRTLSPASVMWENYNVLKQRFPEVDLAEGDPSQEGANVTHSSPSNQPD